MAQPRITIADVPTCSFCSETQHGPGHNSVVFMIESRSATSPRRSRWFDKAGAQALAPTRVAQDRFNEKLPARPRRHGVDTGGARWYLDERRQRALWSGLTMSMDATRKLKSRSTPLTG